MTRAQAAGRPADPRPGSPGQAESGSTLVELLIAMMVISFALLAVLGALEVGIRSALLQRTVSTAELGLRSLAEHVKYEPYVDCAGPGDYGLDPAVADTTAAVVDIAYWDGDTDTAPGAALEFTTDCASQDDDNGLQRVRVSETSASSQPLEIVIMKRRG